jgi:uncharacterized protein (DUF2252 family)
MPAKQTNQARSGTRPRRHGRARPSQAQPGHPTPVERAARGKAARADVRRSAHADWEPAADRPDPVELLEEQARTRVPELVPIRYGRMLVSPLAFFRGAARVMASDLAHAPRTALTVQLSGDAHLSNFGVYASPDRRLVFSLNDFDETLPGPFEWDVKRLVASFAVAGRERGFGTKQRRAANLAAARSYRLAMRDFAEMRTLDVWYARLEVEAIVQQWAREVRAKRLDRIVRDLAKRRTKDQLRALAKLTEVVDGERRIVSDPPLIVPIEELLPNRGHRRLARALQEIFESYLRTLVVDRRQLLERFRYAHVARKVVGVGSVGMQTWIVLLLGRDDEDPLFLQLKEAQASVLEPFLGGGKFANQGRRVVEGQRLTQAARDVLLGWTHAPDIDGPTERDYYVRQLWDGKASANIEALDPKAMELYAEVCGRTLAHAHARSGDPIALAGYLGSGKVFDRALASFAETYADQNERDYAALETAAAEGRVKVETGL